MQQVWKYELDESNINEIDIPKGGVVLSVQNQRGFPCIWVLVNPSENMVKRRFEIYETGHNIQIGFRKYIGTFQLNNGSLVFHLFELL